MSSAYKSYLKLLNVRRFWSQAYLSLHIALFSQLLSNDVYCYMWMQKNLVVFALSFFVFHEYSIQDNTSVLQQVIKDLC